MALLRVEYASKVLKMDTDFQVFLPDTGGLSEAKVVYLLHGLTDNCTAWTRYSFCERYARERNVALVMPEVQRSFYIDGVYGLDYFTYVAEELPQVCQRMFSLSADRKQNYVMGLSMGGFGALKCALTFPQRYAGCGSFSGVTDLERYLTLPSVSMQKKELTALLGAAHTIGSENDLAALAAKAGPVPQLYLSCGEQDDLYEMNNRFSKHLTRLNIPHRYDHRVGNHSWLFWDQSIQDRFAYLGL